MEDILHSDACSTASKLKKCYDCRKAYWKEIKRQARARIKLNTKQTRLTTSKNTSKYFTDLCEECKKDKKTYEYCGDCKKGYNNARNKNSRNKKRQLNQSNPAELIKLGSGSSCNNENISNTNSGIHSVNSKNCAKKCKQSNQSNPAGLINLGSVGSGEGRNCDSEIINNDNSDIYNVKKRKRSIYYEHLCSKCRKTERKYYCDVCEGAYNHVKRKKSYEKK